ncbi:MAG: iron ABC transporter permease [Methylacidiphilales bacterium]|nr:iron ABC transporter permease [Candidatus Methylacidiphilales bacterium]
MRLLRFIITLTFFLAPIVSLVTIGLGFDLDNTIHVASTLLDDYIRGSLRLLVVALLVAVPIGVLCGFLIAQYQFTGARFFRFALLLPLAIPSYITGYSFMGFLESNQPNLSIIRSYPYSSVGIIFGLSLYPYLYMLCLNSFSLQQRSYYEIGKLQGQSQLSLFLTISLKIAFPSVVIGSSLIGLEVLSDFGLSKIFGLSTFTTGIFRVWNNMNDVHTATLLSLCLVSISLLLLSLEKKQREKINYYHIGTNTEHHRTTLHGFANLGAVLFCSLPLVLGFGIPVYQLLEWSSHIDNFDKYIALIEITATSVAIALISTILLMSLGLILVNRTWQKKKFIENQINPLSTFGYALPGLVVAISISGIASWLDDKFIRLLGFAFSGSVMMLCYAYIIRFIAVSYQSIEASMQHIKPSMQEQYLILNPSKLSLWRGLYFPLLKDPLFFTAILIFIEVIKELPATLMLRPLDINTLSVRVFELVNDERLIDSAPLSLTLISLGLISVFILNFLTLDNRYVSRNK